MATIGEKARCISQKAGLISGIYTKGGLSYQEYLDSFDRQEEYLRQIEELVADIRATFKKSKSELVTAFELRKLNVSDP